MNIYVKSEDFGFWTQVEIPVVRYDESSECCGAPVTETGFCTDCKDNAEPRKEIIFCNHGGAETEEVENQVNRIDQPDIVWTSKIVVCEKCGAWRHEGERDWEEAPFEGAWK